MSSSCRLLLAASGLLLLGALASLLYPTTPFTPLLLGLAAAALTGLGLRLTGRRERATRDRLRQVEQQRRALRAERERLAAGLALRILVTSQDQRLRYVWAHGLWEGFNETHFLGQTDRDLFPIAEAERLERLKREVLERGLPVCRDLSLTLEGRTGVFELRLEPLWDRSGALVGLTSTLVEITRRKRIEQSIMATVERQRQIADLAARAIIGLELPAVLDEATRLLAGQLHVSASYALELLPDGATLVLRAGSGWSPGMVGRASQTIEPDAQLPAALASTTPLVVPDFAEERRFSGRPILVAERVGSGASMIVQTSQGLYGLLGVYDRTPRAYSRHDVDFLRGLAAVVAVALSRRAADRESEQRIQQLAALFRDNPEPMARLDPERRLVEVNRAFERLVGESAEELSGRPLTSLLTGASQAASEPSDEDQVLTWEAGVSRSGRPAMSVEATQIPIRTGGRIEGFYLSLRDVTAARERERQLTQQALYDPVTGLPNSTLGLDRLRHTLERSSRRQQITAVLALQAPEMRLVRELDGYTAADQLLAGLTRRLAQILRSGETIARNDADELTIVLENVDDVSDAVRVAERIVARAWQPLPAGEREILLSLKIGISAGVSASQTAESLLRQARTARQRIERHAGSAYEVFDQDLHLIEVERLRIVSDLQWAIERQQLRLFSQPIVRLGTETVFGHQAILYWDHPRRGPLAAAQFMPLAERAGLSDALSRWLLRAACQQIREQPQPILVDLPATALRQPGLMTSIEALLAEIDRPPRALVIGLPAEALSDHAEQTVASVQELRQFGFTLALCGVGAGPLSLTDLLRLPVDLLTLDPSTMAAVDSADGATTARRLIEVGHLLGAEVIACDVATIDQQTQLRQLGYDLAQGPLYGDPLPTRSTQTEGLASF